MTRHSRKTPPLTAFAVVAPGLETALTDELSALGARPRAQTGGAVFEADTDLLYRIHLHSRIAARVRVRVGEFAATTLEALGAAVRRLPWDRFVHPRQPVKVEVASHRSRLRHREAVARKAEHAIRDAARVPRRTDAGRPPTDAVGVLIRIEDDRAEVSVDASGDLLHRRGWRREHVGAPLRENLAAACLWLAEWSPGEALLDPVCGSGTFAIEAATIALARPPGAGRTFAFHGWPSFDADAWTRVLAEPPEEAVTPRLFASDRDPKAITVARANARRAGVEQAVRFEVRDLAAAVAPAPTGLVIANPPWGGRIKGELEAMELLSRALRGPLAGWRWALLAPRHIVPHRLGLTCEPIARFNDGGVDVVLHGGGPSGATPP
ncbi:MAG: class I SAM-dependent RNA methyltransferase [Alphaproteobacteria bacterium]|nr:class I SAM-dependent RNA methyltransferase [Alphaproteobacteria bacterium]